MEGQNSVTEENLRMKDPNTEQPIAQNSTKNNYITSTRNLDATGPSKKPDQNERKSLWRAHLKITGFQTDPVRWNKEWEKHLHTLSASDDVFPSMRVLYRKDSWTEETIAEHLGQIRAQLLEGQKLLVDLWADVQQGEHFTTAWLLLEEGERKRHLLKGLEESISSGTFREDYRALCPEITITAMIKQRGRAYIEFFKTFTKGKAEAGDDNVYRSPSAWWDSATGATQDNDIHDLAYTLLTLERDSFIGRLNIKINRI